MKVQNLSQKCLGFGFRMVKFALGFKRQPTIDEVAVWCHTHIEASSCSVDFHRLLPYFFCANICIDEPLKFCMHPKRKNVAGNTFADTSTADQLFNAPLRKSVLLYQLMEFLIRVDINSSSLFNNLKVSSSFSSPNPVNESDQPGQEDLQLLLPVTCAITR